MSLEPLRRKRLGSTPESMPHPLWRVFPWDVGAAAGSRFSPSYIPRPSGRGRFDLPQGLSPVLYTSESPEHAVSEMLHPWRGRTLESFHLTRADLPLALVEVRVSPDSIERLADLCDPSYLASSGTPPDKTASRFRDPSQPIARAVWDAGFHGLRWWSRFWGDWHTVVLFTARAQAKLRFAAPEVLTLDHPAVRKAAEAMGMPA